MRETVLQNARTLPLHPIVAQVAVRQIGETPEVGIRTAVEKRRVRACTRGPLPLRLIGQRHAQTGFFAEPNAEGQGLFARDTRCRLIRVIGDMARHDMVHEVHVDVACVVLGIEPRVLVVGHLGNPHRERLVDSDDRARPFVWRAVEAAHDERPGRHRHQPHDNPVA